MKLSLISPLDAQSSYGLHTMALARRLPRHGIEVVLRPSRVRGTLPDDIAQLVQHGANDADVEMILSPPTLSAVRGVGRPTLYYSMCESTRLKPEAVALLNTADLVAVPSDWCATVFSSNGVTRPMVTVPLGCDEAFQVNGTEKTNGTDFIFACAGNMANGPKRKGIERVMELFRRAFPEGRAQNSEVRLKVKLNGSHGEQSGDPRITFHTEFLNEPSLASWLSGAHCFVNLATGGFELWPLQAMRCGVPVIGFTFGGMGQYLNAVNGLVVSHHLVPAQDVWAGQGDWAEADDESVIAAMRYAAANPKHCAALGTKAHESVKEMTMGRHVEWLAQLLRRLKPKPKAHVTEAPSRARPDLITVVFPVCDKDIELAIAHAEWLATLPMRTEHTALVAWDAMCPMGQIEKLRAALQQYFPRVDVFQFAPPPVSGWPQAANWAFQQVALYMARGKHPWLWLEPDCAVLSEDWLLQLQAEYDRAGKPFMGAVVQQMGHMNGCGVYPADVPRRAPSALSCTDVAFDFAMKTDTAKETHDASHLLQHIWSVQGESVSENLDGPAPVMVSEEQARRWLKRDAVLVHRIKDDSLVTLLRNGFRKTRVEVVLTNWRRPANIPRVRDSIRAQTERVRLTLIDASERGNECDASRFDRVFRMPNCGSWNRMVIAGGYDCEYTLFIDDDVLAGPTMVEEFLRFADAVENKFAVLGFKGRRWTVARDAQQGDRDGRDPREVEIVDQPQEPTAVGWLARVYFLQTKDIHHGVGERHRIGNRLRLPSVHIDAVLCLGITRATQQPCYVLPSVPGMEWDALPANDAVWRQTQYSDSLRRTLEKLTA